MLDLVAARVPRGPVRDVDGVNVRALRYAVGLSLMDFGAALGKEKVTIYRWELGGIDEITWLGLLSKFELERTWKPDALTMERARREVEDLRQAARDRDRAEPKKPTRKPKAR